MGCGLGSNCGDAPGLPVRRRDPPAAAALEVALREEPDRSAAGGCNVGAHECGTDMFEDADAMDGAAELAGVDRMEPVCEDEAEERPTRMKSVTLRMSMT